MNFARWTLKNRNEAVADSIKDKYGASSFIADILSTRISNVSDLDELFFCKELESPFALKDMNVAVNRIKKAIEAGEKIAIYGDYDCDGICATAMLGNYLSLFTANILSYIPERLQGYGLSIKAVDSIKSKNIDLIITVDNGAVAFDEAEYIKECGIDLIITDHHNVIGDELPAAVAVVNPRRKDDFSKFKDICGAVVVFKLIAAMEGGNYEFAFNFAGDLAAIATIGDVMPLVGENRLIAKRGIKSLNYTENSGLFSLLRKLSIDHGLVSSRLVAFGICPRLNAPGRLGCAYVALKLLTCKDKNKAEEIADELCNYNLRRKKIEDEIFLQAKKFILENRKEFHRPVLVVYGQNWESGLVGLIAGKLMEIYCKPVVVLSVKDGIATGSVRSFNGFSVFEALQYCSEYFIKWGGHELAGGLTLLVENLELFKEKINEFADICIDRDGMFFKTKEADVKLNPRNINVDMVKKLKNLEPFGSLNPQPVFLIEKAEILEIIPLSNGKYVKLRLMVDLKQINVVCFNFSISKFYYEVNDFISLLVNLEINSFRGMEQITYRVIDIRPFELNEKVMEHDFLKFEKFIRSDHISNGLSKEDVPTRTEFLLVYDMLKKYKTFQGNFKDLYFLLLDTTVSYCKLLVILEIFIGEKLVKVEPDGIEFLNSKVKISLNDNSIFKNLMA